MLRFTNLNAVFYYIPLAAMNTDVKITSSEKNGTKMMGINLIANLFKMSAAGTKLSIRQNNRAPKWQIARLNGYRSKGFSQYCFSVMSLKPWVEICDCLASYQISDSIRIIRKRGCYGV